MNPLYSRLAVGFLIWFLGVPAVNAGCNVGVSLLDPNASFAGSIYDDESTRRCTALEPVQWYPGDPREVAVFADADLRRSSPQPEALGSLLSRADIYLLRPEVPEADFEGQRANHIAAQLAGLAPEMHVDTAG